MVRLIQNPVDEIRQLVRRVPATSFAYAGLGLFVWAVAVRAHHVANDFSKRNIAELIALLAIPFLILQIKRLPVTILVLYAALIPLDNVLTTSAGATVTKLLGMALGGAMAIQILVTRRAIRPSVSLFAWFVWVVYMAASFMWAIDYGASLGSARYATLFLLFVAFSLYPVSTREIKLVMIASVLGATLTSLYGDVMFHQGSDIDSSRFVLSSDGGYIDPNHFAAALLVPFLIALVFFLRSKTLWTKVASGTFAAVLLSGIYVSASRGATLGIAGALLYLIIRTRFRWQLLTIGVPAALLFVSGTVASRFGEALSTGGNGRLDIWSSGFEAFKQHWLAGAGVGNFQAAYLPFYLSTYHLHQHTWKPVAHNLIVQTAVELGAIGLILVLTGWFLQFRDADRLGPLSDPLLSDMRYALAAGTIALFIGSFFLDIMWMKYTWFAFSLTAMLRAYEMQERDASLVTQPVRRFAEAEPRLSPGTAFE